MSATWKTDGWYAAGGYTKSAYDQVVDVTGGGYCGSTAQDGIPTAAFLVGDKFGRRPCNWFGRKGLGGAIVRHIGGRLPLLRRIVRSVRRIGLGGIVLSVVHNRIVHDERGIVKGRDDFYNIWLVGLVS